MATRIYFPSRTSNGRFPVALGFSAADLTHLQIALNQMAFEADEDEALGPITFSGDDDYEHMDD